MLGSGDIIGRYFAERWCRHGRSLEYSPARSCRGAIRKRFIECRNKRFYSHLNGLLWTNTQHYTILSSWPLPAFVPCQINLPDMANGSGDASVNPAKPLWCPKLPSGHPSVESSPLHKCHQCRSSNGLTLLSPRFLIYEASCVVMWSHYGRYKDAPFSPLCLLPSGKLV